MHDFYIVQPYYTMIILSIATTGIEFGIDNLCDAPEINTG